MIAWKKELADGNVNNDKGLKLPRDWGHKSEIARALVEWYIRSDGITEKATGRANHDDEARILIDKTTPKQLMAEFGEYC